MHMADALISPAVGGVMLAVSGAAVAAAVVRSKKEGGIDEKRIPVMGVMSAFVFAAQMINFTIPGTGSSGHIGGGILLAAMLGGSPGLISITAVLLIQALFFADGGLLALGCNVFNMGVIPCLLAYPLIFRPILRRGVTPGRITLASVLSVVLGLQFGAFCVVLETLISGVTALPFGAFALLMQPIHLAIGLVEGVVTAAVLVFVWKARPELLECAAGGKPLGAGVSVKKVVIVMLVLTVLVGGGLSIFASAYPDGLEWSIAGVTGEEELSAQGGAYEAAQAVQDKTALMPDYSLSGASEEAGTSASGLIGGAATLVVAGGAALIISGIKRKKARA